MGIVYSQGDYLVTTQGDSIVGIKILSYPAKGIINVNGYNTKLNIKYEDFHIAYKSSAGSEESKNYSDIKCPTLFADIDKKFHDHKGDKYILLTKNTININDLNIINKNIKNNGFYTSRTRTFCY